MERPTGFAGEVGYIAGSIKTRRRKVGDTVTRQTLPKSLCPATVKSADGVLRYLSVDGAKYGDLKDALEITAMIRRFRSSLKPRLHSASAIAADSRTSAYGIIQERLEREYRLDLITTAPSVI